MSKLAWVLLPVVLAAAGVALAALRGRPPSRLTLNVASSLLLLVYVAITAGLGIFWVANQQLPVFDWHYLFGYVVVGLLVLHLVFNFRVVWRHLRRPPTLPVAGRRPLLGGLGAVTVAAAGGIGYWIGLRHGRTEWHLPAAQAWGGDGAAAAQALVEQFHAVSSHTRTGALRKAPTVNWGDAPPVFKPVAGAATLALPAPATASVQATAGALDGVALGTLLWHTAGVSAERGGLYLRTSPSSGALFATELYVVVRRVAGVEPGLWHYDARHHRLARLRDDLAAAPGGVDDAAVATVVATAVFRRSGRKYGDRTYRYVLADLGHALENLRVATAAVGGVAVLLPHFDEAQWSAWLGVDEAEEGVLAVVRLGVAGAPPSLPGVEGWRPAPMLAPAGAALGITAAVHRATSLRRDGGLARRSPPAAATEPPGAEGGLQRLPVPRPSAADVLALIARRRSVRRYAAAPVHADELSALLAAMAAQPAQVSTAIRIDVLTLAVQGLPVQAWRYLPAQHALRPQAGGGELLRARARAAALDQDVVGDAALVVVLSIDRSALTADAAGAARGYRHAFIEAGMAGERAYLEGEARGLGVCSVGAFYDDEAARLVGADPAAEWVVHFVALGRRA